MDVRTGYAEQRLITYGLRIACTLWYPPYDPERRLHVMAWDRNESPDEPIWQELQYGVDYHLYHDQIVFGEVPSLWTTIIAKYEAMMDFSNLPA